MLDHHATWGHPPSRRPEPRVHRWQIALVFGLALLGLLAIAAKAIPQAAHDAAACPTFYTEGC